MNVHATIYRADSALARCRNCGAQRQFHGRPNFTCTVFDAETAADIEPADLATPDLVRECDALADQYGRDRGTTDAALTYQDRLYERLDACRSELDARLKAVFGVAFDDFRQTMGF